MKNNKFEKLGNLNTITSVYLNMIDKLLFGFCGKIRKYINEYEPNG